MGLFSNRTEEEKTLRTMIRAIKSESSLEENEKECLVDYVTKVMNGGKNNDFFELDYFVRAITSLIEAKQNGENIEVTLEKYRKVVKQLLPEGKETTDYKAIMEMILNNYYGENGFISKDLQEDKFYALFQNRYDYLYFMNLIVKDNEIRTYANKIFDYAIEVSRFCANPTILQNELLSFINGIEDNSWDFVNYSKKCLEEAKKRCGVYPIDEKTLAMISKEVENAQFLIEKLNEMKKRVDEYEDKVLTLTKEGKEAVESTLAGAKSELNDVTETGIKTIKKETKTGSNEIRRLSDQTTKEMREYIAKTTKEIEDQLDQYLITLEESLKDSSNQVFNSILEDARKNIREIKLLAQSLSKTTTSELIRIRETTEESVDRLKSYVENEPQLQELLKGVQKDEAVKEALIKFSELQAEKEDQAKTQSAPTTLISSSSTPGILIPGNDRIVVPANPSVVVPEKGSATGIIPAFDESIPFNLRLEKILAEKERREAENEIFHEKTEEVIRGILEGDWYYLWGPSGCGKSYTIKQIAKLIGIDMVDNGKITDKFSVMAYNDPQGRFRATQAFVALVYGKLLLLDELDNGNPDTQVVLNELYSGLLDTLEKPKEKRYVTFAEDMTVPIHPNFRMISAGNTSGEGENQVFSSRGKMDESVQQRMTPKRFWYDNRVEQRIFGEYENWYNIFINFRKACDSYASHEGLDTPVGIVTTRDASAIMKYIKHNSKSVNQVLDEKFVQTKNSDYLKYITKKFKEYYNMDSIPNKDFGVSEELGEVKEIEIAKKLILQCNRTAEKK